MTESPDDQASDFDDAFNFFDEFNSLDFGMTILFDEEQSHTCAPFVSLTTLLELKIASSMTTTHRPRDLDDVLESST